VRLLRAGASACALCSRVVVGDAADPKVCVQRFGVLCRSCARRKLAWRCEMRGGQAYQV
jgi:hypothetical protein